MGFKELLSAGEAVFGTGEGLEALRMWATGKKWLQD